MLCVLSGLKLDGIGLAPPLLMRNPSTTVKSLLLGGRKFVAGVGQPPPHLQNGVRWGGRQELQHRPREPDAHHQAVVDVSVVGAQILR